MIAKSASGMGQNFDSGQTRDSLRFTEFSSLETLRLAPFKISQENLQTDIVPANASQYKSSAQGATQEISKK